MNELRGIGCTPAGDEVPTGSGVVALNAVAAIVARQNVVIEGVVLRTRSQSIELWIQEAERMAGELVGVGNDTGPLRRPLAGATDEVPGSGSQETAVNQNGRIGVSIIGDVG